MGNRHGGSRLASFSELQLSEAESTRLQVHFMEIAGRAPSISRAAFVKRVAPELGAHGELAAHRVFDLLDSNRNNMLSFEQFSVGVCAFSRSSSPAERLELIFFMFETERSGLGAASLAELLMVVSLADGPRGEPPNHAGELYQPLLDMMAQAALSRFDGDRDGKLSSNEFAAFAESEDDIHAFVGTLAACFSRFQ
mmetsp:Transcript_69172/g.193357  ORF Transcript_69172/g.193357 Transcript_69172/m.193357 type:complete len:196 (+) Transcript_69172:2790-3377(+)|eukprot:CAMPEP_0119542362 /NCGR_PEP_ID=MMETSP1344-20130328/53534_1 /TAXON_ID=236787 /ORGANISM="Florenciella parvula, Strain CCMP2471" /LENGTH=195 /DNA_ID=CAMNT_0007586565 /DNA_START=132 /DNA_END=719 /DNA_ORIENTATION=+